MRIITGSAKGTRLETLEGEMTRPTSEKVKEAIFSMIQFDVEGKRILDLFGGSGQLGSRSVEPRRRYCNLCRFKPRGGRAYKAQRPEGKAI